MVPAWVGGMENGTYNKAQTVWRVSKHSWDSEESSRAVTVWIIDSLLELYTDRTDDTKLDCT